MTEKHPRVILSGVRERSDRAKSKDLHEVAKRLQIRPISGSLLYVDSYASSLAQNDGEGTTTTSRA